MAKKSSKVVSPLVVVARKILADRPLFTEMTLKVYDPAVTETQQQIDVCAAGCLAPEQSLFLYRVGVFMFGLNAEHHEQTVTHLKLLQKKKKNFLPVIITHQPNLRSVRACGWPYEFFHEQTTLSVGEEYLLERLAHLCWKWRLTHHVDWML